MSLRQMILSILRAYEWDRINFSSTEKCEKVAQMMNISIEELQQMRQDTLRSSIEAIHAYCVESYLVV